MRSITFILLISIVLLGQFRYIDRKEGFKTYRCQYYDVYDNIIYANQIGGLCPELEIISQTETGIEFETTVTYFFEDFPYSIVGMGLTSTRNYGSGGGNAIIKTHTIITYTEDLNIKTYETRNLVTSTYIKDGQTLHDYVSTHRVLTHNNDDYHFEQIEDFAFIKLLETDEYHTRFFEFEENQYQQTILYSDESDSDNHVLMESVTRNNETETTELGILSFYINDRGQEFFDFIFYDEDTDNSDTYIYDISHSEDRTYGEFIRIDSRLGGNLLYSLDYSRRIGEDNFYYSYISGINYAESDTIWNFKITNILDGTDIYTTGVHFYNVENTHYGKKVTRLIEKNDPYFGSLDNLEDTYYTNNSMYENLYDYKYQIIRKNMFDPYYIVKPYFPFAIH